MKKYLVLFLLLTGFLVACNTNDPEQAGSEEGVLNTVRNGPVAHQGGQIHGQEEDEIPVNPGREQNIFEDEQGTIHLSTNQGNRTEMNGDQSMEELKIQLVGLTNQVRKQHGLNYLKLDSNLSSVAQLKSEDMAVNQHVSHDSPHEMLQKFGIDYSDAAAENIANGVDTPKRVLQSWMEQPSQRRNVLNKDVTHIGVGYEADGHYWTQLFIRKDQ
ncbi:CAP domain-containing protein [Aquibacillus sediminis]|uniref:CAP domain-containing protein n=1 Tax=Aquibacillus sediminis TaxID=2574734 RepID=UPI0011080205|nr:CAP domain-containing protein [Aquibacillus sediminis]